MWVNLILGRAILDFNVAELLVLNNLFKFF
jgi:hypothetical protein